MKDLKKSEPKNFCYAPMQEYPKHTGSKEQQASAGNWGKPSDIDHKLGKRAMSYPNKFPKAKRKKKKLWKSPYSTCPFCNADLEHIGKRAGVFSFLDAYSHCCKECGAGRVDEECPSCKSKTTNVWKNPDGIYTHQGFFKCGFRGKRIEQGLLHEIDFGRRKKMKRQQVFVRAQTPSGKWVNADVLDLDEFSFRAFVIDMLFRGGFVYGLKSERCEGPEITYTTKYEVDEDGLSEGTEGA